LKKKKNNQTTFLYLKKTPVLNNDPNPTFILCPPPLFGGVPKKNKKN
jgi:hypothetical protein